MEADTRVLTVAELGTLVRDGLAALFPGELWVEGQVSGLRIPRSGHAYFDLVEPSDEPGRQAGATLSVALWRQARTTAERTLAEAGSPALCDDLHLRIRARLDFYPPAGRLQLVMTGVDPTFTLGRLAAERDRLLRTLAAEGLLDRNASLHLPEPALRIGLVTSIGSAAHADFSDELARSGVAFTLLERDTGVQGEGAAEDVAAGLRTLASHGPDVIALVRGGGSAGDLSTFDAEVVARCIAGLPVPVFTGIGHEVDRSVADEVAHTSFKTPTACAAALAGAAHACRDRVERIRSEIAGRVGSAVGAAEGALAATAERLAGASGLSLRRHVDLLAGEAARLSRSPVAVLSLHDERIGALDRRLRALDPARVLARGWSVTRTAEGRLVRSTGDVGQGEVITTLVSDGTVTSTVG